MAQTPSEPTNLVLEHLRVMRAEIAQIDLQVKHIQSDVSGMKTEMSGMKADISSLKADVSDTKERYTRGSSSTRSPKSIRPI